MKYGYVRVSLCGPSKIEQQREILAHGVLEENIFYDRVDAISTRGVELVNLLEKMNPHDVLVVTTLDRIAESPKQLAQFCRSLVRGGIFIDVLDLGTIDDSTAGKLILETLEKVVLLEEIEYKERSIAGKKRAKMRNQNYHEGRPPALITKEKRHAYMLLKQYTYQQVAKKTGFSVSTLKRIKNKIEKND
ncbi:recombinase family protein [Ligilactobacillus acidipiscis]|uniref:recombinase family protein n=1 Tax=Ligilactobacillus acidipiscis TaxID=89059 RepID=UPI0022E67308|nr:recombinase family protein [Ligilactobacillus acidipiscis]